MQVGPACESPNPIQRWEVGHPYLVRALLIGWFLGWPALQVLGLVRSALVVLVAFLVFAVKFFVVSRRAEPTEDRGRRQVVYVPWPSWLPG